MYSDFYDKNNDGIIDDEDIEEFNYGKSKEDFYNKNAEKILAMSYLTLTARQKSTPRLKFWKVRHQYPSMT